MRSLTFFLITFFLVVCPKSVFAIEDNQFINIVNPVRISTYTPDAVDSIKTQYSEISKNGLSATWLLTYDSLKHPGLYGVTLAMNKEQELGVFLEITPLIAEDSGVLYNKTDSWHRANVVFTAGYKQEDRLKMIDQLFNEFFKKYHYFPKSVGAWWIDAYSLEYMQRKYGIVANLGVADQHSTDGYQLWGQYWSMPFYPSKYHAGIPAQNINTKIDLVTLQWAPRDPLNGYGSTEASLFSVQDYLTVGLNDEYLMHLINLYAKSNGNRFGQLTIGLESDLPAEGYKVAYARQMKLIKQLKDSNEFKVVKMEEFANWYKRNFPETSPDHLIQEKDFFGKPLTSMWYQNVFYRIGIVYDQLNKSLKIIDLRTFQNNFQEPFYLSPNKQIKLSINLPSVIDTVNDKQSGWEISDLDLISIKKQEAGAKLQFQDDKKIELEKEQILMRDITKMIPATITKSPVLDVKQEDNTVIIKVLENWVFPIGGLEFEDISIQATYFLNRNKVKLATVGIVFLFAVILMLIIKSRLKQNFKKFIITLLCISILVVIVYLIKANSQRYFVNQGELDALIHLAALPYGKVIVYNQGCLICTFHTKYPPAIFGNRRNYVREISKKPIVYNLPIFITESRIEGRKNLDKIGAKYIYLVKFEDYEEKMPFSPGDYNVEKVYENANAEIWKIQK